MTEIPEDVMKLAREAFADTKVISASLVAEDEDSDVLPYIINSASPLPLERDEMKPKGHKPELDAALAKVVATSIAGLELRLAAIVAGNTNPPYKPSL